MNYILDEQKNPVLVPDTTKEGRDRYYAFRSNFENMRVGLTQIGSGRVSTVFLGIDHSFGSGPPVLWETMVFDIPEFEDVCERYTSHADAVAGHEKIVSEVQKALDEKR